MIGTEAVLDVELRDGAEIILHQLPINVLTIHRSLTSDNSFCIIIPFSLHEE